MKGECVLVLETGEHFVGESVGAEGTSFGELCFNTAMTGYQEVITDPSYAGQIILFTYPLIGNYGVEERFSESDGVYARGLVVHQLNDYVGPIYTRGNLRAFLREHGVVAISSVDTRAITKIIRSKGELRAGLSTELPPELLLEKVRSSPTTSEMDLVKEVVSDEIYEYGGEGPMVVVVNLGVKRSILRNLRDAGLEVVVVPPTLSGEDILSLNPDGVVISNGPGDPARNGEVIETISQLLGRLPMMGICMGHQLFALAVGGRTYKLKFGHHGANHGVHDVLRDRTFITSQNHSFAVDPESLPPEVRVSHWNVNDSTVEGLVWEEKRVMTFQFHPEAHPGPWDANFYFRLFAETVRESRPSSFHIFSHL